jgi:hypothetical protein
MLKYMSRSNKCCGKTDKKKRKIVLIYQEIQIKKKRSIFLIWEIQMGSVAKYQMRKGFLIYEQCANI